MCEAAFECRYDQVTFSGKQATCLVILWAPAALCSWIHASYLATVMPLVLLCACLECRIAFPAFSRYLLHQVNVLCAVQFGHRLLQWLTQHMLKSNMSVRAFVRTLRLCMLQFYSTSVLSSLAASPHLPGSPSSSCPLALKPADADPALWKACAALVRRLPDEVSGASGLISFKCYFLFRAL